MLRRAAGRTGVSRRRAGRTGVSRRAAGRTVGFRPAVGRRRVRRRAVGRRTVSRWAVGRTRVPRWAAGRTRVPRRAARTAPWHRARRSRGRDPSAVEARRGSVRTPRWWIPGTPTATAIAGRSGPVHRPSNDLLLSLPCSPHGSTWPGVRRGLAGPRERTTRHAHPRTGVCRFRHDGADRRRSDPSVARPALPRPPCRDCWSEPCDGTEGTAGNDRRETVQVAHGVAMNAVCIRRAMSVWWSCRRAPGDR